MCGSECSGAATSARRSSSSSATRAKEIEARTGIQLEVARVAVRNLSRDRDVEIDPRLLTNDAHAVVTDPDVDLVVEVIGGIEPARELISAALAGGKPVVTANKELLANVGVELFEVADEGRRRPALRGGSRRRHPDRAGAAREPAGRADRAGDGHRQRHDELHPHQDDRAAAWPTRPPSPRRNGSGTPNATRPPTSRVSMPAPRRRSWRRSRSGTKIVAGHVYHEGISNLSLADIDVARRLGYVVKLLAVIDVDRRLRRDRRARPPGDGARAPPARQCARELQRRVRRGWRRRVADVLRTGRRWRRHRRAPCSATSSTLLSTSSGARTDRSDRSAGHASARSTN